MPATNLDEVNVATRFLSFQGKPLNMGNKVFTNGEVRTLGQVKMPAPAKGLIYVKLSAGALTYKVHVNTGTAAFGSAQVNRTVSDTAEYANEFAIGGSTTDLYVDTELTAGGSGATVERGCYRFEMKLPTGRGYHEAKFAWNTLGSAGGNYSTALT